MNRMVANLAMGLITLGAASGASAAIVVSLEPLGPAVNDGDLLTPENNREMTGWGAYKLVVSTDSGYIQGINVKDGERGIFAPMHQRWLGGAPSPTVATAQGGADSYLLYDSSKVLIAPFGDPVESIVADSPEFSDSVLYNYGIGDALEVNWGFTGGNRLQSVDVAYLVLQPTATVEFIGSITLATAATGGTLSLHYVSTTVAVPEPAGLGLLALGAVPMIRRRRA